MGNNELTIWGRKHNNIPDSEGKHVGQEPKLGASVGQGSFGKYQKSSWEKKKKKKDKRCLHGSSPPHSKAASTTGNGSELISKHGL